MMALKDLVKGPENIIATSRVSNRVIIILQNKKLVDEFLTLYS